jgi:hypothetical protein
MFNRFYNTYEHAGIISNLFKNKQKKREFKSLICFKIAMGFVFEYVLSQQAEF